MAKRNWTVLLIGGHSAAGKTTASELVGRSFVVPWMMMNDLRLAFQRAGVVLPEGTEALYFDTVPSYWRLRPQEHCDALIAVGEALSAALEAIIENHVDQSAPIVIEGDGILPSLLSRTPMVERAEAIRTVFSLSPRRRRFKSICWPALGLSRTGPRINFATRLVQNGCLVSGSRKRQPNTACPLSILARGTHWLNGSLIT